MKLAYIDLCGFRGYRKPLRIDFPEGFTIIDGRNGAGKSTVFDAIEFALTGTIAKYRDARADRETVNDYIWWRGQGPGPADRYVEVGFCDNGELLKIRRTQLGDANPQELDAIQARLCDTRLAPKSPLPQLCLVSIIRDEHIAALSLDLKETERYKLLRDAIGAIDSDVWIARGSRLVGLADKRVQVAKSEVDAAANDATMVARRVDGIRAALVSEATIALAVARLQSFSGSSAALEQLSGSVRTAIAAKSRQLEELVSLDIAWPGADAARARIAELQRTVAVAREARAQKDAVFASIAAVKQESLAGSAILAQQARNIADLIALGRKLGLNDGHCPLCASERTEAEFNNGLALAERYAKQLDAQAFEQAELERAIEAATIAAVSARDELGQGERLLGSVQNTIAEFELRLATIGLSAGASRDELRKRQEALRVELGAAREDLRIIETISFSSELEKALHDEAEAKSRYARAEAKLGLARRAESRAKALHDAARRAAGETLNRRLERVLPLMVELYRRLRPHPVWGDIEYKIRGDVQRFLRLQVGDELNPQFIFSSGQRRVTGLAFLLSVNLSLAWSRWRTILLDDPVQHVDDFRSIHLAEVMAQLQTDGRQIICAVEDAALADLLCRRLPVEGQGTSRRVTVGPDSDGALAKLREQDLVPLIPRALVTERHSRAG